MTAQIPDTIVFGGERYALTALEGKGLFEPTAYGITLAPLSTACWRGSVCLYEVSSNRLRLSGLEVGQNEGPPPVIGGVAAVKKQWSWHYDGLAVDVPFTGRVLIGRGDVSPRPYLNMGFWPAWYYATVWDLTFNDGNLRQADERSAEAAKVRAQLGDAGAKPQPGEAVDQWIKRTFSLSYAYSWPDVGNPNSS